MEYVTLNDCSEKITDYVASGSFASLKENVLITNDPNYAVMVKTADFSNGFSKNLTYTDKKGYDFLHNSNLFGGELILSNIGSIGKVFIVPKLDKPMTLASNSIMVKPNANYDTKFLYYLFSSSYGFSKLKSISSGTSMQKFNKTMLKTVLIPKYTLPEQQKIAAHLDSIQSAIDNKKQQLQQLDELVKSKFVEMFGDPIENEKNWTKKKLKDTSKIITGNTPPRSEKNNYGDYLEWIKTDNITEDVYITKALEYLSSQGEKKGRIVEAGAILMACIAGSLSSIGRVALTNRKVAFNQQINAIIPSEMYNSYFLYILFNLSKKYTQSTVQMALKGILSKGKLEELEYIVPPIELQNTFSEYVQKIDSAKSIIKTQLNDLNELLESKMDLYFGE